MSKPTKAVANKGEEGAAPPIARQRGVGVARRGVAWRGVAWRGAVRTESLRVAPGLRRGCAGADWACPLVEKAVQGTEE